MQTKKADPLIWGAVASIIVAGMVSIDLLTGGSPDRPGMMIGQAFFWGWVAGRARNADWLNWRRW